MYYRYGKLLLCGVVCAWYPPTHQQASGYKQATIFYRQTLIMAVINNHTYRTERLMMMLRNTQHMIYIYMTH